MPLITLISSARFLSWRVSYSNRSKRPPVSSFQRQSPLHLPTDTSGIHLLYSHHGVQWLEAFLTSTPADLRTQSRWMVIFSIGFIVTAVSLSRYLHWGDAGLVWANIANLGFRALYAWRFTRRFYIRRGGGELVRWQRMLPPPPVFIAFSVAAVVTRWSAKVHHDMPIYSQLGHVSVGIVCIVGCLITW